MVNRFYRFYFKRGTSELLHFFLKKYFPHESILFELPFTSAPLTLTVYPETRYQKCSLNSKVVKIGDTAGRYRRSIDVFIHSAEHEAGDHRGPAIAAARCRLCSGRRGNKYMSWRPRSHVYIRAHVSALARSRARVRTHSFFLHSTRSRSLWRK